MGNEFYFDWEPRLMEWIQSHLGSFGVNFLSNISAFGEEKILIAVMCVLYFIYDKEAAKFVYRRFMIAGCGLAWLKNIVCRLRPYFVHPNVRCLKPVDPNADIYDISHQGYSFPSGHSEGSAAIFGGTAIRLKKTWLTIVTVLIVLLVGVSRFCLGVHYPTDVLGGWAIGIGSIFLFSLMEKLIEKRWIIYLIWIVVLGTGFFFCTTSDYYTNYGMLIGAFASDLFEEKYVKFPKPRNLLWGFARIVGALALYFGINTVLKLPFSSEFLSSATVAAYSVRVIRYAIVMFVSMGVYPLCFRLFHKNEQA